MKLGFITSILDGWTYEQMMDFASEQGFECVEVALSLIHIFNICSYSSSMKKVCQKNKIGHIKKKGQIPLCKTNGIYG